MKSSHNYNLENNEYFPSLKWVNYANEMNDDVMHSTQYYIEYINI